MNKLKRKGLFGRLSALALSITMLGTLPSCGPDELDAFTKTGKVMVIGKSNPDITHFWEDVKNGAEDAGTEMGYEVTFQSAENDNDIDSQKGFINDAIRDEYDVIVLAPNSKTALEDELKKATAAGIKIININSACDYKEVKCVISSSDGAAASTCCDEVIARLQEKYGQISGVGKIGIIAHTADTADSRVTVFKNRLANEIMMDLQSSGQSIQGGATASSDENGVVAVLEDGTELLLPEEAANRAAAAAAKSGLKGDDVVNAATEAAEAAVAALKAAGYDIGDKKGSSSEDPAANMMTPDEAAQKALEEAKADSSIPPQQYGQIAQAAAEKQAAAIEEARAEAGYDPDAASSQESEGGAPVDANGVEDPAYGMKTPDEAAQEALEAAKKDIGIEPSNYASIAQAAYEEQEAAIAKAREEAGYTGSDSDSSEGGQKKGAFYQLQEEYFIEGNRCTTAFQAFEATLSMLDADNDNIPDDTGIKVMYATNTATTLGVCQAIEQLGLGDEMIVVGYNSDEKIISYLKTGILDATIVQNPYSMGYLGVIYAKKLVDGDTISKSINTGVTLVTAENISDDYIKAILYPGQETSITSNNSKSDNSKKNDEASTAATEQADAEAPADSKNTEEGGNK